MIFGGGSNLFLVKIVISNKGIGLVKYVDVLAKILIARSL